MAARGRYDSEGNLLPGNLDSNGLENGSLAQKANQRKEALDQSQANQPGAVRRFIQGYGLPTSGEELGGMVSSLPPVQLIQHPSWYNLARMSPLVGLGEGIGNILTTPLDFQEGNIAGGMGKIAQLATPWIAGKLEPVLANSGIGRGVRAGAAGFTKWASELPVVKQAVTSPIKKGVVAAAKSWKESAPKGPPTTEAAPVKAAAGPKAPPKSNFSTPSLGLGQDSLAATDPSQLPATPGAIPGVGRGPRPQAVSPVPVDPATITEYNPVHDPGPGRGLQPSISIPTMPQPTGSGPINSPDVIQQALAKAQIQNAANGPTPVMYQGPPIEGGAQFGNAPRQQPFLNPRRGGVDTTPFQNDAQPVHSPVPRQPGEFMPGDQSPAITSTVPEPFFNQASMEQLMNVLKRHGMLQKMVEQGLLNPDGTPAPGGFDKMLEATSEKINKSGNGKPTGAERPPGTSGAKYTDAPPPPKYAPGQLVTAPSSSTMNGRIMRVSKVYWDPNFNEWSYDIDSAEPHLRKMGANGYSDRQLAPATPWQQFSYKYTDFWPSPAKAINDSINGAVASNWADSYNWMHNTKN